MPLTTRKGLLESVENIAKHIENLGEMAEVNIVESGTPIANRMRKVVLAHRDIRIMLI